ncbi:NO-inducible flavohemoprotein [Salsuginibacillus kocurii]|uniref:NO-inducible flavohemoprotein n=1 Tax=Salsuginibacillus kocurii TaxID=427078 RepID=UPI00037CA68F|nr:NO-inducible flavohemoprotein [Salsuginibacillus kocurii]
MLDEKTIRVIKSTVPVLEEHGETITTRFYEKLFENHPELLNIFNQVNQKKGRQQAALANSVYAAAVHIDQLENILPVVKQIGHKHRSLGVLPEHYPIVGKYLLEAMKEVLEDQATEEILTAWEKAYGVIATAFIDVEQEMYKNAEEQPGGWSGFRNFIVADKVKESELITSFYLKAEDGLPIASFSPGQYVSITINIEGEKYSHIRQYSLSDAPGKDYYRISVKREQENDKPDGKISNHLHQKVQPGDILPLSAPAGDFILTKDNSKPVVLISGGVGITPLMSMLNTIVEQQPEREVLFIHATHNGKYHAMQTEVQQLSATNSQVQSYFCYTTPTDQDRTDQRFDKEGYLNPDLLVSLIPFTEAEYYFCGPVSFMRTIKEGLEAANVPAEHIHYEFFGPAMQL